jgi:hypothetical protein
MPLLPTCLRHASCSAYLLQAPLCQGAVHVQTALLVWLKVRSRGATCRISTHLLPEHPWHAELWRGPPSTPAAAAICESAAVAIYPAEIGANQDFCVIKISESTCRTGDGGLFYCAACQRTDVQINCMHASIKCKGNFLNLVSLPDARAGPPGCPATHFAVFAAGRLVPAHRL